MKNPPKVKVGDRVRAVVEGEVRAAYGDGSAYIGSDSCGSYVNLSDDGVTSVEVIRPAVAVGDVLTTQDDYARAPNSTVIHSPNTGGVFVKNDNGDWVCGCRSCEMEHRLLFAAVVRTVIYVPTEATQ